MTPQYMFIRKHHKLQTTQTQTGRHLQNRTTTTHKHITNKQAQQSDITNKTKQQFWHLKQQEHTTHKNKQTHKQNIKTNWIKQHNKNKI